MKKYIYSFVFAMAALLVSCSEDKGNYEYESIDDISITLPSSFYNVVSGGLLKIIPSLTHTLEQNTDHLSYVWEVNGEVISTERELNTLLPAMDFGTKLGALTVTDNTTGMKFIKTFQVNVVGEINWGYYFLTEDEAKNTVLSYIPAATDANTDIQVVHTKACGEYAFASSPISLISKYSSNAIVGTYYTWAIAVLAKGEGNQIVITDGSTFMPKAILSAESFVDKESGYTFNPETAIITRKDVLFLISDGKAIMYNKGLLYRPAVHDKEYYWDYPIASAYGDPIFFAYDRLSQKYYALKQGEDKYAYDTVWELRNSPNFTGKHIVSALTVANKAEYVCAADEEGLHLYEFYVHYPVTYVDCVANNTLPVSGAGADTKAVIVNKNDWYFFIGNKVYTSPVKLPQLSEYLTIPEEYGKVTAVSVSAREKRLAVATYNENSDSEMKGSILFIDIATKEITAYKNSIHKCVSCLAANESTNRNYGTYGDEL